MYQEMGKLKLKIGQKIPIKKNPMVTFAMIAQLTGPPPSIYLFVFCGKT